eukprot:CAMPEP_0176284398 /NCGR_PEP_ID=MMETSP0121_2-20121125/51828_1 /TAXON_ID=160619 /ORGANISM="Kryptoperidinium foliaceum, Strain CCMP 1326" /LENGTH=66 /DNA_ID=CAMNT_0017624839 /DNA_START=46 /DNA_END=243 /DNA_ORIENTATION=-
MSRCKGAQTRPRTKRLKNSVGKTVVTTSRAHSLSPFVRYVCATRVAQGRDVPESSAANANVAVAVV